MWHDIEQNTDDWLDLRSGKVTGSAIAKVMANYGKAFGKPAQDLAATIAVEQLTGQRQGLNGYSNSHMERGHIEEPIARALYEDTYFIEVGKGGFYDNGNTGCSPDGRVADDGLVEIKSGIISVHYNRIKSGSFDSAYKWQLLFNMQESNRVWIDFISFCSDFPDASKLYTYRLHYEDFESEFKMMKARLNDFYSLVKDIKKTILGQSVRKR